MKKNEDYFIEFTAEGKTIRSNKFRHLLAAVGNAEALIEAFINCGLYEDLEKSVALREINE